MVLGASRGGESSLALRKLFPMPLSASDIPDLINKLDAGYDI